MYLNVNLSKSFQKVFRENVNVLSSSSGKDNFYVFLLFLAETNWQIIVITFSISFQKNFNIFRNTYFLFPNPLLCDAQGLKKRRLFLLSKKCEKKERKRERTHLILSISSEDVKFSFMSSTSKLASLSKLV